MAPKRQWAESSQARAQEQASQARAQEQAPPVFDNTRFVNADTEAYFYNVLVGKTFILEWGLWPDDRYDGEMSAMIVERNWIQFTEPPPSASISIVKEFYANVREVRDGIATMRGR